MARFNGYLKGSCVVPLAATIEASGLQLDTDIANRHVRRWLDEVANVRVHATTKAVPVSRLTAERAAMLPAPAGLSSGNPDREPATSPRGLRRIAGGGGMNLQHKRIAEMCHQLKFTRLASEWPALAQVPARDEGSFADFLESPS